MWQGFHVKRITIMKNICSMFHVKQVVRLNNEPPPLDEPLLRKPWPSSSKSARVSRETNANVTTLALPFNEQELGQPPCAVAQENGREAWYVGRLRSVPLVAKVPTMTLPSDYGFT
jgi:hypothetical protein